MTREKISVFFGFLISWLAAAKSIHRLADGRYMGGYFFAGWPIEVKLGLATPTGSQVFWAALANSWIYILFLWLIFTFALRRTHKR